MNKVMRVTKKKLEMLSQEMAMVEETGLPIGLIEIKHEKKCEMIFDIFNSLFKYKKLKNNLVPICLF
jgi:hypothetical protein